MCDYNFIYTNYSGQVQRLIEEATATENLMQMYIGWQPWA
jgi:phosphatidylinositol kinase/protein kinase (PI-3  family)